MQEARRRQMEEMADRAHGAMVGFWLDGRFEDAAAACRLLSRYFSEMSERPASGYVVQLFGKGRAVAGALWGQEATAPFIAATRLESPLR